MPIDLWALTVPAAIGAVAWLYQKAWERHERRLKQYEEILDLLPGFVEGGIDPTKINSAIAIGRRLWLVGPDNVVRAFDAFTSSIESSAGHDASQEALGKLVLAMRRDVSVAATLVPRRRTTIGPEEFHLKSAKLVAAATANTDGGRSLTISQSVGATIVSNGALLLALQAAMRWAVIDRGLSKDDLKDLEVKIASAIENGSAEGFKKEDVQTGKNLTTQFIATIGEAIRKELDGMSR
jgi:hypothetical protein